MTLDKIENKVIEQNKDMLLTERVEDLDRKTLELEITIKKMKKKLKKI